MLAAALWLAVPARAADGRGAYLVHVSSVCSRYAAQLSRIGAPADVAAYGDVIATAGAAARILRAQLAAMRAVAPPPTLKTPLAKLFALDGSSIAALAATVAGARRRDAGAVARGLARFAELRGRTHAAALALGIDCSASGAAAA